MDEIRRKCEIHFEDDSYTPQLSLSLSVSHTHIHWIEMVHNAKPKTILYQRLHGQDGCVEENDILSFREQHVATFLRM